MVPPAPDRPAAGPQPIAFPGDADPGGRDDVAADPAGAQASAEARFGELESDTFGMGSQIGHALDLPPVPDAGSKHTGRQEQRAAAEAEAVGGRMSPWRRSPGELRKGCGYRGSRGLGGRFHDGVWITGLRCALSCRTFTEPVLAHRLAS